jgi:hypothetical protein
MISSQLLEISGVGWNYHQFFCSFWKDEWCGYGAGDKSHWDEGDERHCQ